MRGTTDLPVLLAPAAPRGPEPLAAFTPGVAALLAGALVLSIGVAEAAGAGGAREGVLAAMARWTPLVFGGFLVNVGVSVAAMALGTAAGVALGLARVSPRGWLSGPAWAVTQFFRNAPWLVLLFYAMLTLPYQVTVFGQTVPLPGPFKAVIGLALPVMANVAEIVRGGVGSIPLTQWESAESLAFTRGQTLRMVILPQALRRMIPPWMNLYAVLTMATTLVSIVGVQDGLTLTRAALAAEGRTELLIPMYGLLLGMFFAYCYPVARWTVALERRVRVAA